MSDVKILVSGDVNGQFKHLFAKVNSINDTLGPFEYLFCVGNFFGLQNDEWEGVKSGDIAVPVTTYILGPNDPRHEKFYSCGEMAPNVIYLGKKGFLSSCSGLKIAYLSGIEVPEGDFSTSVRTEFGTHFSKETVKDMINSVSNDSFVDILLTSQWPSGVTKHAIPVENAQCTLENYSSIYIAHLAKVLKPRYHFCGLAGAYYERFPYRNHKVLQESPINVTRFFGIASIMQPSKQKSLYAFNIVPACHLTFEQLIQTPEQVTECPYEELSLEDENTQNQFFYGSSPLSSKQKHEGESMQQSKKQRVSIDSSSCWFCLSNVNVERERILSIGDHCYVTLAKGMLVPEHVLIIPIDHTVSSLDMSEETFEEAERFKDTLTQYYHDRNKDVVFFERNYKTPHLQIQVIPVPKNLKCEIEHSLSCAADYFDCEMHELPCRTHLRQIVSSTKPFFYMEVREDTIVVSKHLHMITKGFPLHFGREVLACSEVLNVEERIDWKRCQESREEGKLLTEEMRRRFGPYDFTTF